MVRTIACHKLERPFKYSVSPEFRTCLYRIFNYSFSTFGIKNFAEGIVDYVLDAKYPIDFEESRIPYFLHDNSKLLRQYKKYKADLKAKYVSKILDKYIQGTVFLDVGCGNNSLSSEIAKKHNIKAIGVDIIRPQLLIKHTNVEFRLQEESSKLPLADDEVDLVTMISVLHHVEAESNILNHFFRDIIRVIDEKGRIVILEDSWSHSIASTHSKNITRLFIESKPQEQQDICRFMDFVVHRVMKRDFKILIPRYYRSTEEWLNYFKKIGLRIVKFKFLGFLRGLFCSPPMSIFILES